MQVDFVENVTTKINCLRMSVYWPYNQLFAHVFGSMGEHIQLLQLFLTTYNTDGRYVANVFLKKHSAISRFNCLDTSFRKLS